MVFYSFIIPERDFPYFEVVRNGCTYSYAADECAAFNRALEMCAALAKTEA